MKVVIPLAGLGKRMRPHTPFKAKPMVRMAGRPILGHLLEWVGRRPRVDEVILIISPHQTEVEGYARTATSQAGADRGPGSSREARPMLSRGWRRSSTSRC